MCVAHWVVAPSPGHAADPGWWSARGAVNTATPAPNAVVNQGQLKQFTLRAVQELNATLAGAGGAGEALNTRVALWGQDYAARGNAVNPADFNAVTLGQLKYIAKLIDTRLQTVGYLTSLPSWLAVNAGSDNTVAVLGQLKSIFNFDLKLANAANDANGDQIADWWENYYFHTTNVPPGGNLDGDSVSNLQEFQQGTSPNDYYNDSLTKISIESGNNQSAGPNAWVANPLVVGVTDGTTNAAKANAPIVFASATAQLATSPGGTGSSSVEVRSNAQGKATVYLKLPATGSFHQVTASANYGAPVIFYAGLAQLTPSPANIDLSVDQGEKQERIITLTNSTSQSISYVIDPSAVNATFTPQDVNNPEYNWLDSRMAGGPAYVWNDISTPSNQLAAVSSTDDTPQQVDIGFNFSFFGAVYSSVFVSPNGYLTFGASSTAYSNTTLPGTEMPSNLIAAFFDDLNTDVSGDVYCKAEPGKLTLQYSNVALPAGGSDRYTFQIVLDSTGVITCYYKTMSGAVNSATVGIQNGSNPRHGRQVAYNQAYIQNGLALQFRPAVLRWLQIKNYAGAIAAGQSANLDVTLGTLGLPTGIYTTTLHLKDGVGNTVGPDLPVTWTVSGNVVADADGDGLPDGWKTQHFVDLSQGANDDPDHDGLSNLMEYRLGSDPLNADTNGDGIVDGVAYRLGISLTNLDMDGDGLTNAAERQRGADPFVLAIPTSQNTNTTINDHTAMIITLTEPAGAILQ